MNVKKTYHEINFDCLPGPTHHFGGLSFGNLASTKSKENRANPKAAALQGLEKMKFLFEKGIRQAILPPHPRPHLPTILNLGFNKKDLSQALKTIAKDFPQIFSGLFSSSSMWAANSATMSPSSDSHDGRAHFSIANLQTMFHRRIESSYTFEIFKEIFSHEKYFRVHAPLLCHDLLSDEGAANHNRLCLNHSEAGLEVFVYGRSTLPKESKSKIFPARQSLLASQAIKKRHQLLDQNTIFIEQNPLAIDQGAFHNDVVCVMNESVILCHELAFYEQEKTLKNIAVAYKNIFNQEPLIIEIKNRELSIEDAVATYLFNSQLLTKKDGSMLLFAPIECQKNQASLNAIKKIVSEQNPINEYEFFDLTQSMKNGGGPACLRLRCLLSEEEINHVHAGVFFNKENFRELRQIIESFYPSDLTADQFFDPDFLLQVSKAQEKIIDCLKLPAHLKNSY